MDSFTCFRLEMIHLLYSVLLCSAFASNPAGNSYEFSYGCLGGCSTQRESVLMEAANRNNPLFRTSTFDYSDAFGEVKGIDEGDQLSGHFKGFNFAKELKKFTFPPDATELDKRTSSRMTTDPMQEYLMDILDAHRLPETDVADLTALLEAPRSKGSRALLYDSVVGPALISLLENGFLTRLNQGIPLSLDASVHVLETAKRCIAALIKVRRFQPGYELLAAYFSFKFPAEADRLFVAFICKFTPESPLISPDREVNSFHVAQVEDPENFDKVISQLCRLPDPMQAEILLKEGIKKSRTCSDLCNWL